MGRNGCLVLLALTVAAISARPCEASGLRLMSTFECSQHWCSSSGTLHCSEERESLWAGRFDPCRKQLHESSCGHAALANLLSVFYDFPIDEETIVGDEVVPNGRSSLAALLASARRLGFAAAVYRMDVEVLQQVLIEVGIPVIGLLHEPGGHFVIAVAAVYRGILVFDPALGFVVSSQEHLRSRWSGFALVVDPGAERINACLDTVAALVTRFDLRQRHLVELSWIVP